MGGYDAIAEEYAALFEAGLSPTSVPGMATASLVEMTGPVGDLDLLDLCCGEGHLSRHFASRGARVLGVDLSLRLIAVARERGAGTSAQFLVDDAQGLVRVGSDSFDRVVCNLALMDIPDLRATRSTVHRVLRPGGRLVFSITHPCFQAPGTRVDVDAAGNFVARRVSHYAREGFWRSAGSGTIRSRVGAHHRTLATYANGLIDAGFILQRLVEPTLPAGEYDSPYDQAHQQVPSVLVASAERRFVLNPAGHPGETGR